MVLIIMDFTWAKMLAHNIGQVASTMNLQFIESIVKLNINVHVSTSEIKHVLQAPNIEDAHLT
jgi:hypothetical protein